MELDRDDLEAVHRTWPDGRATLCGLDADVARLEEPGRRLSCRACVCEQLEQDTLEDMRAADLD